MDLNFDKWFEWLNKLPPVSLLCVFVLVLGYLMKRSEWIPNKRIPLVVSCVGALLYLGVRYGWTVFLAQGFVMSALVTVGHRYFIRPFEEKYPWLKDLLCGKHGFDSNPTAFVKGDKVVMVGTVETAGKPPVVAVTSEVTLQKP